jgi:hypothetical protein
MIECGSVGGSLIPAAAAVPSVTITRDEAHRAATSREIQPRKARDDIAGSSIKAGIVQSPDWTVAPNDPDRTLGNRWGS